MLIELSLYSLKYQYQQDLKYLVNYIGSSEQLERHSNLIFKTDTFDFVQDSQVLLMVDYKPERNQCLAVKSLIKSDFRIIQVKMDVEFEVILEYQDLEIHKSLFYLKELLNYVLDLDDIFMYFEYHECNNQMLLVVLGFDQPF